MADISKLMTNLKNRGYKVSLFDTACEAADYIDSAVDGVSVGIGGSATVKDIEVYEKLISHNTVYWHWKQEPDEARKRAAETDIYLTSANALAETGEMVNIDGIGNRVSSTLFGHKKIYFIIGTNKITDTYEEAVWRARNIAAPLRAAQLNKNTPCAVKGGKCYDCKSPERICRGMVTLFAPMSGMEAEVILIKKSLGL